MKNYETELPEGYAEAMIIDAKSRKTTILFNLVAVLLTGAVIAAAIAAIKPTGFYENYSLKRNIIFLLALPAYIVLHELTHGAAYKLLTGRKLTFGVTLTVAFCGVPDIFVYRRSALISLLAPFVLFSIVFGIPVLVFADVWDKFYAALLLALHIGGCVGDLYDTILFTFKFRDADTLMQDTGPKQTIYIRK